MTSSSACAVAPDVVADSEVALPVAVPDWSATGLATSPENSLALTAFAVTVGCVTVIMLPLTRAVVIVEEKTTVRTPDVPDPFVTSAFLV